VHHSRRALPASSSGNRYCAPHNTHSAHRCPNKMLLLRRSLNFSHVSMVHAGSLPIVPGNRDRVPTRFGDKAAVSGITSPINPGALCAAFRFVDCHSCATARSTRAGRGDFRTFPPPDNGPGNIPGWFSLGIPFQRRFNQPPRVPVGLLPLHFRAPPRPGPMADGRAAVAAVTCARRRSWPHSFRACRRARQFIAAHTAAGLRGSYSLPGNCERPE
jgi:hypothetical protein